MFVLWQRDSISMRELAEQTVLDKSTLTRMVEHLESSGHVERKSDEKDRRKVIVLLTDESRWLQAVYEEVSARMSEVLYDGFSEDEIEQFEDLLRRVLGNLVKRQDENKTQTEYQRGGR